MFGARRAEDPWRDTGMEPHTDDRLSRIQPFERALSSRSGDANSTRVEDARDLGTAVGNRPVFIRRATARSLQGPHARDEVPEFWPWRSFTVALTAERGVPSLSGPGWRLRRHH
jgi:hypothetical protein